MNAMTWWDHDTLSVWSQPWGTAIMGPLKGTTLRMIPASLTSWSSWKAEHPDTTVLDVPVNTDEQAFDEVQRQFPLDEFVIGAVLGEYVKAYRFTAAASEGVINDSIGEFPVVVLADPETRNVHVFIRNTGNEVLTFELRGGELVDRETGTVWDPERGLALEGPLKGINLQQVPYTSAADWAWLDFYPDSDIYGDDVVQDEPVFDELPSLSPLG